MKPSRTLSLAVLTGLLLSACGGTGPAPDTTKPSLALTATPQTLTASGSVRLVATASDNVGVKQVTFFRGNEQLAVDTEAPYEVTDNLTAGNNGTVTYRAVAADAAGNTAEATAAVTVNVDTTRPTADVMVVSNSPTSYTVNVAATDSSGISRVEILDNGKLVATDTEAPYSANLTYTAADNGPRTILVRVYDAQGNVTEVTRTITVNVDATKPALSVDVVRNSHTSYTVNAVANDDQGVTRVEFYDGGKLVTTDTTAPYSANLTYTAADNGPRTILVRAYDAQGNVTEATRTITVSVDTVAPVVTATVTQPVPGQVTVTASASDDQAVTRVEFYENGVLLETDASGPYVLERTYTAAQNGQRTIVVRAYDAQGNMGETTVRFTVDIDTPPTVSLSLSQETLTRDGNVTVTANAQDDRGISKVEFYVDGVLRATDTESPYTAAFNFTFRENGSRVITVRAYDTAGQTAEATQTITVALEAGEINDMVAQATAIGIGQQIDARIAGVPRDYDYYSFTGAAGDRLRLTVRGQSGPFSESTLDPYVMVLMPDGKTVLEKDDDSGQGFDSELLFNLPQAGTYYIVVTSFDIADDPEATDDRITNQYRLELSRR